MDRRDSRWHWSLLVTLVLTAGGILEGSAPLLAAATIPLALIAYESVGDAPAPAEHLVAERRCRPERPMPGEQVSVELTVTNRSERTLADVRVVDGVPDELEVVDGSAAGAESLRPGEELALQYTLDPARGEYAFEPPTARLRSVAGSAVATGSLSVTGDAVLGVGTHLEELTIADRTTGFGGTIPSDTGGPGFEFYATREYRAGDPINRVDWRRLAKSGSLGTIEFREHRSTRTVVLVDARWEARKRPGPDRPDGATIGAYAGVQLAAALREGDREVGLAALGVQSSAPGVYAGPPAYVEPGSDVATAERIRRLCDAVAGRDVVGIGGASGNDGASSARSDADGAEGGEADSADCTGVGDEESDDTVNGTEESDGTGAGDDATEDAAADEESPVTLLGQGATSDRSVETLLELLPPNTQLLVCSPLLDDEIGRLLEDLHRQGVPTTVLSPNLTNRETPGARTQAIERAVTIARLRGAGVTIVDWDRTDPLRVALEASLVEGLA